MFSVTKPQQHVDATSPTGNVVTETANTTRNSDSVATMRVCRVCLTMSVKMYHISKHRLSVMYERVTGVVINTEDVLPKMLCWECVSRLSSAHNFLEKSLRTHWLLVEKLKCSKFVTINDIESIDRAQYQLVSTLGFNHNKEDCSDFHIVHESDKIYENEYGTENFNYCEGTEVEYSELNDIDLNIVEETIIKTEVTDDKDPIKIEYLVENEEQNVENEIYIGAVVSDEKDQLTIHSLDARIQVSIKENINDEEEIDNVNSEMCNEENQLLVARELCEEIKQSQKTQERKKRRTEALPRCKELRVVLEDIRITLGKHNTRDMSKQPTDTDESSNKFRTLCHPPIERDIVVGKNNAVQKMPLNKDTTKRKYIQSKLENKNVCDPVNAEIISTVSTGTVDVVEIVTKSLKNVFICDICGEQFQLKTTLRKHIRKHLKSYSCTYCSYKTNVKRNLNFHVNAKHTKTIVYNCSYCSYAAYTKQYLARHINVKHTKENVYNCSFCNHKTYEKGALNAHVNVKHTKKNVKKCSFCSYETCNITSLIIHVNTKHTKTNVFNCSHCSFKAYSKQCLNKHVNAKHTKTNVFNCSHCSFKAYTKPCLNKHVNAKHTKTDAYICDLCNYKTYAKSSIVRHINAKHTKTKVFNCSLCSFKAYRKDHVNAHMNAIHTKTR